MPELSGLPGADWVERGLADLAARSETAPALLVAIAGARLRRLGLLVPVHGIRDPELKLFERLQGEESGSAHSRYNALLRSLGSFVHALEREQGMAIRKGLRPGRP